MNVYQKTKEAIRKIALESGAYIAPFGYGKKTNGCRTMRVEALHCPTFNVRCAPTPHAMIDRIKEEWYEIEARIDTRKLLYVAPFFTNNLITYTKAPQSFLKQVEEFNQKHKGDALWCTREQILTEHNAMSLLLVGTKNYINTCGGVVRNFFELYLENHFGVIPPIDTEILWSVRLTLPLSLSD